MEAPKTEKAMKKLRAMKRRAQKDDAEPKAKKPIKKFKQVKRRAKKDDDEPKANKSRKKMEVMKRREKEAAVAPKANKETKKMPAKKAKAMKKKFPAPIAMMAMKKLRRLKLHWELPWEKGYLTALRWSIGLQRTQAKRCAREWGHEWWEWSDDDDDDDDDDIMI